MKNQDSLTSEFYAAAQAIARNSRTIASQLNSSQLAAIAEAQQQIESAQAELNAKKADMASTIGSMFSHLQY